MSDTTMLKRDLSFVPKNKNDLDTSFFYFKDHRCVAILSSALLMAAEETHTEKENVLEVYFSEYQTSDNSVCIRTSVGWVPSEGIQKTRVSVFETSGWSPLQRRSQAA